VIKRAGRKDSKQNESWDLNGKLHLILAYDGKVKKVCTVCSNRKVKGGTRGTSFYCDVFIAARIPPQQMSCHISHSEEV
jgi:hypothetical protein